MLIKADSLRAQFEQLLGLRSEEEVRSYLQNLLGERSFTDEFGNIISGDGPVAVVCHMDTVFDGRFYGKVVHDSTADEYRRTASGLGGDDRCGIALALEMLRTGMPVKAFFFTNEEHGGTGSGFVDLSHFNGIRATIGLDWEEAKDVLVADYAQLCSGSFRNIVEEIATPLGYNLSDRGVFSDASNVRMRTKMDCTVVPMGYFGRHQPWEYVSFRDLLRVSELVSCLVERVAA